MVTRARHFSKSVYSDRQLAFCQLIRKAREDAGLTQAALAKLLKRPQSFVAKYERGERRVDIVEYLALAEIIHFDPIRLLRAMIKR